MNICKMNKFSKIPKRKKMIEEYLMEID